MYAPGTGSKWCLMNVLMYLWLAVLGLCALLCGQGAVAMHLQSSPPPPPQQFSPRALSLRDVLLVPDTVAAAPLPISHRGAADLLAEASGRSSASVSSSVGDLDKRQQYSQSDKNVWYRIWRRRRQLEILRRRRKDDVEISVHDTRPEGSSRTRAKRDSRFGRYTTTRMFQPSLVSPVPLSSSSGSSQHLHPKFYTSSPVLPSPQLTSVSQRLGFGQQQQQHSHRQMVGSGVAQSHNTMLIKPKEQHGLPGSAAVPIPYTKPVPSAPTHHHTQQQQHSVPMPPGHNIHQQPLHNVTHGGHNHNHNHRAGGGTGGTGGTPGGGGSVLPLKGRKYCSARDPANLAFEAGVVFEGRVRSMSTHNYSVTFQVLKVHKTQPGFGQVPSHIRVHFKQVKNLECDLHLESFRNPAHIRGKLDQGRTYFIFGKFVEMNNFTLIGQPMRSSEKHQREVRNGLSETYGQTASIEKLLVKGRPNRPVKLICKVNGRPPPTVTWFKGSQLITRNRIKYKLVHRKRQSQLIIRTYDLSDSGVYECRAKNRLTKHSANATIRVDFSHYLSPATVPGSPSPHFPSTVNPDTRPHSGGSAPDEEDPLVGAEECPPEQKERYCMNGGKCVYFSGFRVFSCQCVDGFGGERCNMKMPTTYNHSSMYSTQCERNTYLGSYYC